MQAGFAAVEGIVIGDTYVACLAVRYVGLGEFEF